MSEQVWRELSIWVKAPLNKGTEGGRVTVLYELNVSHRAGNGFCTGSTELIFTSALYSHCDLKLLAKEKGKGAKSRGER